MRKYTLKNNKDRFLFPEEYLRFENELKAKQKFSVRFLINTGARINEARNVKKEDIDFENNRIIFKVTKAKAKKGEKKGKIRIIPISSQFSKYLKKKLRKLSNSDYIGVLSNPALSIAYDKAGLKANIKDYGDISSHTFRKTLEVWLMALGVQDLALTAHLGHDIRTASSHYVSPNIFNSEDKMKMRDIIGDLYQN